LPLFGRFGYVEMTRFLMIKDFFVARYLPVHRFATFVVFASASGVLRSIYRGIYATGGYDERYFFPTWIAA
jgi:hypothetical protein